MDSYKGCWDSPDKTEIYVVIFPDPLAITILKIAFRYRTLFYSSEHLAV
jgi:hypothetical protein